MTVERHSEGELVALNADVVGYSRMMADNFELTSERMAGAREVVERSVTSQGGQLVNFVGDNFMATFGLAIDGVQAAIEISTSLEQANADHPSTEWLRFRMGMDRGPVTVSDGHFEGDSLNIAARIQALAPVGGLSISDRVYLDLDEPALRFRPSGAHRLKNIPEPVEIYEFADLPSDGSRDAGRSSLALERPIVAVLPIHTDGVDEPLRSAAGVIRADLMHRLSMIPELGVVDAEQTDDGRPSERAARYMLETGVHQFGDRVRAYAMLFDVTTMNVVKSHKTSGGVDDLPDLSEELAEEIGRSIEVDLVVGAPAGLYAELADPVAIEKVYQGWYELRSDSPDGWRRALDLFGEVAAAHPDLPYGWVLSGFANWLGAANGWADSADATFALAAEQARRGVSVGDPTGMAQAVEAAVLMSSGRIDEAVEELEALEIVRPTCDVTYGLAGSLRRYLGQWEQAVDLLDVAMRLTGINKPWYPTVKATSLFIGNRVEEAASVAETVLDYQPRNLEALMVLAAAQAELGLDRRAKATADQIRHEFPALDPAVWLESNPYQDPKITQRWQADLAAIGLIEVGQE